jgi:hypothetical protein
MDKRMAQGDLTHQIGPEIALYGILMVVVRCLHRRWRCEGGIFHPQKLEMFWLTWQQPAELWTNGCHSWIQQVGNVQKQPWKDF